MPDFENIIQDFGSDAKNLVSGDVEIGGKKIPKVVIAGVGVGGLALFLFIAKRGKGGSDTQSAGMPLGIGNASPSEQNTDNLGSALDALGNQLGGIPTPELTPPTDIGFSNGDLGGFLNQIPIFGGESNPAFSQLPDLSGFGLSIPSNEASSYTNQPYSQLDYPNQSSQVAQLYANQTAMLTGKNKGTDKPVSGRVLDLLRGKQSTPKGIPIKTSASGNALSNTKQANTGLLKSLLSGFSFAQKVKPTTTGISASGSGILKTGQSISNIFGGSKPQPVLNQGNAVTVKPSTTTSYFSNIFGSYKPVQSLPKPPVINYGSIGYNWSNPLPLPKPPTISYGSSGFNWSNPPKPTALPQANTAPKPGGFSSVFSW